MTLPSHMPSWKSQSYRVLQVLLDGQVHSITAIHRRAGTMRLNSRVAELRKRGWDIRSSTIRENGRSVWAYQLFEPWPAGALESGAREVGLTRGERAPDSSDTSLTRLEGASKSGVTTPPSSPVSEEPPVRSTSPRRVAPLDEGGGSPPALRDRTLRGESSKPGSALPPMVPLPPSHSQTSFLVRDPDTDTERMVTT